jgi:hypothetical protein
MSIADVSESAILALIFNATSWANYADNASVSPQTQIAVALHTADPGDTGNMSTNEIGYTSYGRVNVNRNTGGWAVSGSNPTTVNPVASIDFPAGTGGTGTASFFSTGRTGGGASAILFSGTVTPNITCGNGITPRLSTATAITLD